MNDELSKKLFEAYPNLYGDRNKPHTQTLICYGFECGDGWYEPINKLSAKLEAIVKDKPNVRASQVKEKYGGLRFYMTEFSAEIEKLITEAEDECSVTCETCGKPGELHTSGGWLQTLCDACVVCENNKEDRISQYIKYSEWTKIVSK